MHQDIHRASGGTGQELLYTQRHRHDGTPAVGGACGPDDRRRLPRHPRPRLHRRRVRQGREDHTELCRGGKQDGLEERNVKLYTKIDID